MDVVPGVGQLLLLLHALTATGVSLVVLQSVSSTLSSSLVCVRMRVSIVDLSATGSECPLLSHLSHWSPHSTLDASLHVFSD